MATNNCTLQMDGLDTLRERLVLIVSTKSSAVLAANFFGLWEFQAAGRTLAPVDQVYGGGGYLASRTL